MNSRYEREILEILRRQMGDEGPGQRGSPRRPRPPGRGWLVNLVLIARALWLSGPWSRLDPASTLLLAFGLLLLAPFLQSWASGLAALVRGAGLLLFALAYVLTLAGRGRRRRLGWRGYPTELPPTPTLWERWLHWWRQNRGRR